MNSLESSPAPPHPRLISKMAVVARFPARPSVGEGREDEVYVRLFCKVNIRNEGYARHHLFPGDNITLLSTSAYPLHSPQSSLVLNPLPPLLIQQAAQSLNVSTTVNAPSTTATSRRRSQKVKIVQDASVYLISEAGDTAESFEGGGKPHVPESDRGEDFLKAWIVVLEMAVRLKSAPPLDRYAVTIPLPRCLSNTLLFHLKPASPEDKHHTYSFLTTPRLLPGLFPSKDSSTRTGETFEGTFQSTTSLEVRWAPQSASTSRLVGNTSQVKQGGIRPVVVRCLRQKVVYDVKGGGDERAEGDGRAEGVDAEGGNQTAVDVRIDWEVKASRVYFPGVESIGHLDFTVDSSSEFTWVEPPTLTANRGLASSSILIPPALSSSVQSEVGDVSTRPSASRSSRSPLQSNTPISRYGSGESSSHPSLLRQKPPTAVDFAGGEDVSFAAFDQSSGNLSLDASPSSLTKHLPLTSFTQPLAASSSGCLQAQAFRLNLNISQIHASFNPFVFFLSGVVRLRLSDQGETILPEFEIEGAEDSVDDADGGKVVSIRVPRHAKVFPPSTAERLPDRGEGESWKSASSFASAFQGASTRFTLLFPSQVLPEGNISTKPAIVSPSGTVRRESFLPPTPIFSLPFTSSDRLDPPEHLSSSAPIARSIHSVDLEVFILPAQAKGDTHTWDQLSRMKIGLSPSPLSPSSDSFLEHEEDTRFEFGILAGSPTSPSSSVFRPSCGLRILSVTAHERALPYSIQLAVIEDPSVDVDSSRTVCGALGYVCVSLNESLRRIGGVIEITYIVSRVGEFSIKGGTAKEKRTGWLQRGLGEVQCEEPLKLGLPSFEEAVEWEEIKVHVTDGFNLSVGPQATSAPVVNLPSSTTPLRTITHTLPTLSIPYLSVSLTPFSPLPGSPPKQRLAWTRLPLIFLALWLLLSIGSEVQRLQSGMADMVMEIRGESQQIKSALERSEARINRASPFSTFPSSSSLSSSSSAESIDLGISTSATTSILQPTFITIPAMISRPTGSLVSSSSEDARAVAPASAFRFTTLDWILEFVGRVVNGRAVNRGRSMLDGLVRGVRRVSMGIWG